MTNKIDQRSREIDNALTKWTRETEWTDLVYLPAIFDDLIYFYAKIDQLKPQKQQFSFARDYETKIDDDDEESDKLIKCESSKIEN